MIIINKIKQFDKNENYGWCSFRDGSIIFHKYPKLCIYIDNEDLSNATISEIIAYTHKYIVVEIIYARETVYYFCDVNKNRIYKTNNDFDYYYLIGDTVVFFGNYKYRIQTIGFHNIRKGIFETSYRKGIFIFSNSGNIEKTEYTCVDLKNYFLVKIYSKNNKYYIECTEFQQKILLKHSLDNCYHQIKTAIEQSRKMLNNNPITYLQDNISKKNIDIDLENFYTGNPHNSYFYTCIYSDKKSLAESYANILGKDFFVSKNINIYRKLEEISKDTYGKYKIEYFNENEICTEFPTEIIAEPPKENEIHIEYPTEIITEPPKENIVPTVVNNRMQTIADKLTKFFMSYTTVLSNSNLADEQRENNIIEFSDQMNELLIFFTSNEEKIVTMQSCNEELIHKIKYLETKLTNTEKMLDTIRTARDFENKFKEITKKYTNQIILKDSTHSLLEHRNENNKRTLNTDEYPPNKYSKN